MEKSVYVRQRIKRKKETRKEKKGENVCVCVRTGKKINKQKHNC